MLRRFAVLAGFLLVGACLPQQHPGTAAPTAASPQIARAAGDGLQPPEGARRFDGAIAAVNENRAAQGAVGAHTVSALAIPPAAGERPELPKAAAFEAPKTIDARPPAQPVPRPEPVAPPPPVPASAERVTPVETAAAAPVERAMVAPGGSPLITVHFAPGSADLSDGARLALELFARDPATQRLRRIELWAWASDDDPAEARKMAVACALAVHAYLIDHDVKARIDIGGFAEAHGNSPNRVELVRPGS